MRPLLLAMLVSGLTARAGAQASDTVEVPSLPSDDELATTLSDPSTTSKEAYGLGALLFEAERYEAAERAWLRAHALTPNPTLLLAVADTRERRGDEPGAVAMLEQYLAERPDAPDRISIEARIAALGKSPGVLIVRSEEPGHAILLDGVPVEQKTPARIEVDAGSHTVLVVGGGSEVGEQTVRVAYGEVKELSFTRETTSNAAVAQSEEAARQSEMAKERQDRIIRRASIATGSIAIGSLVTGAVLGSLALVRQRDYRNDPSAQTADQGESFALAADLTLALGVLSGVTSLTLFLTHRNKRKRERPNADLRIEVRGAGASATVRF
jgi:tetratricopeptide (TPR) repeat protein